MTQKTTPRIGFACKWSEYNAKGEVVSVPELNCKSTTHTWIKRQTPEVAEQRLWDIMVHNIEATRLLVERVGELDPHLRMVRVGSDILPLYTHREVNHYWLQPHFVAYAEKHIARIGEVARARGVRLSMHPGQFTVLASDNEGIVQNSIREFEYHADLARWMGYGRTFQDFKINVHISGRRGPEGIRETYQRLSPEARNCITLENEENSWGLNDVLSLSDIIPCVLDIHHHWIREGEYISSKDERVKRVVDSWRGVRPTLHYSLSREDVLPGHSTTTAPDHKMLLESGSKKQKLRAHSDRYWNTETNEWALSFLDTHDIMCESKWKNLASFELFEQWKK